MYIASINFPGNTVLMALCFRDPLVYYKTTFLLVSGQVRQVVHNAAQVIYPVCIWDIGMPALPFTHLFSAPVVEADFRNRIHNVLAIKL